MNTLETIETKQKEIEEIVHSYLPQAQGYEKTIYQAMDYSIMAGGKRLRPMLMQETLLAFSSFQECLHPFMAAIEMIHTYSLVHDDLPAMDNDTLRRGKPTTHIQFGEAMGVLAGDALLNYAFETAMKAFDFPEVADNLEMTKRVSKSLQMLGHYAGVYGMIGGQVVDVESEGMLASANLVQTDDDTSYMTKERLDYIYEKKTSALLQASMGIGAVMGGASQEQVDTILEIARKIGLAFQIQDDVLDVISDVDTLGKDIGSDEKNNKVTYVTLYGIDGAKKQVDTLTRDAIQDLQGLNCKNQFLEDLLLYLINRDK